MNEKLIFVYNAGSDLFSTISDFAHKILSPSTYECHLCALTYGNFLVKQEWKSFIEALPIAAIFLHKDEFERQYKIKTSLPAIFISKSGIITELITKQAIESCGSLEELKNIIKEKLREHVQHHHTNIQ